MRGRALRESWLIDPVDNIERHCPGDRVEDRRLIHVIPKAGNAFAVEIPVERAEPCARLLLSKVRKDTLAGPYITNVDRAIGILDELVAGDTGIVRRIVLAWSIGNMKISDGD